MSLAITSEPHKPVYRVPACDLIMRSRAPGATADLIIPVHLVCNTPEDILIEHVTKNSALDREWINNVPAHDGVAVLCGSGPSLADDLGSVDDLHKNGATIFAMNGAASFLASHGIYADNQVIVDARERTGDLVGPARAHIFGSQAHPSLFAKVPDAKLFQVNFYEDHRDFLKLIETVGPEDFALIGSHGSVGNVALALAYAMGFRNIHVFGYDSSFRGEEGHAFDQPMNVSEPICFPEYNGKKYQCTFTMKSQADVFPRIVYELEGMGATFTVHGSGYLPDRFHGERAKPLEQREREKYTAMWQHESYRVRAPGLDHVEDAIEKLGIRFGDTVLDFGCGTGRATKAMRDKGLRSIGVDLIPDAVEEPIPFIESNLWELPPLTAKWGFCTDVMEHIPPEKVEDVLEGIAKSVTRGAYFAIDSTHDDMGELIGMTLHLTVEHPAWWVRQLKKHFAEVKEYEAGVFVCLHGA